MLAYCREETYKRPDIGLEYRLALVDGRPYLLGYTAQLDSRASWSRLRTARSRLCHLEWSDPAGYRVYRLELESWMLCTLVWLQPATVFRTYQCLRNQKPREDERNLQRDLFSASLVLMLSSFQHHFSSHLPVRTLAWWLIPEFLIFKLHV